MVEVAASVTPHRLQPPSSASKHVTDDDIAEAALELCAPPGTEYQETREAHHYFKSSNDLQDLLLSAIHSLMAC
jgi:hypothetical protein